MLKQRPDVVQQLTRYHTILRDLRQVPVYCSLITERGLPASRLVCE